MKNQSRKKFLDKILNPIAQACIRLYQRTFSPDKSFLFSPRLRGRICRHEPHCSQYALESYSRYHFWTATERSIDRVMRCTPANQKSYDPVGYRTVFMSGSSIGIPFLEAIAKDPRYDLVGVVTMPDQKKGRGMKLQENIIALTSYMLGIERDRIQKPRSLRLDSKKYSADAESIVAWLQSLDVDIIYVIAYGNIIPQHILDIPKIAPLNIHGSLLPAYRGASPLQQVFVDGCYETGVTLMKMEAGLDSGPMIDKQIFKLGFSDTVADLIDRIKAYTPKRSLDSIDDYVHGELEEEVQDDDLATYCGKITKEDGTIELVSNEQGTMDTLETTYRKYKGYYLWPKVFFQLTVNTGELNVIIEDLVLDETLYKEYKSTGLFIDNSYTLNPAILSLKVKPEGKKVMTWHDFENGYLK